MNSLETLKKEIATKTINLIENDKVDFVNFLEEKSKSANIYLHIPEYLSYKFMTKFLITDFGRELIDFSSNDEELNKMINFCAESGMEDSIKFDENYIETSTKNYFENQNTNFDYLTCESNVKIILVSKFIKAFLFKAIKETSTQWKKENLKEKNLGKRLSQKFINNLILNLTEKAK